jgi:hypothetical protein
VLNETANALRLNLSQKGGISYRIILHCIRYHGMLIVNSTTGGTLIRSTWPIYAIFIFSGVFFTPPTTSIGVYYYAVLSNSFIKPWLSHW